MAWVGEPLPKQVQVAPQTSQDVTVHKAGTSFSMPAQSKTFSAFKPWWQVTMVRTVGGIAYTRGLDQGGFGRIEVAFVNFQRRKTAGWLVDTTFGFEEWLTKDGGGIGLPFGLELGYASPWLFVRAGIGADFLMVDTIHQTTSGGPLAPFSNIALGGGPTFFKIGLDFRSQYRWELDGGDLPQLKVGIVLSFKLLDKGWIP
jgi:hypothetical protein